MNITTPLVSIIVPIYGVEKYIDRCVRSIFEQTYENLEIIFVNDCTPDKSIEILYNVLSKYPNRKLQTKIINHEINKGLACARLSGLKVSTGYYIQNIDSDDYLEKNMISEMVVFAEQNQADITICDFMNVYSDYMQHIYVNPSLEPHELLSQILVGKVHSSVCNKLIKRSLYFDYNIFPIEGLDMREDLSVIFRLLCFTKKIAYIPQPFYYYQQSNISSYTSIRMNISHQKDAYQLIELMDSFLNDSGIDVRQSILYFKAGIFSTIALYGDFNNIESRIFKDMKLTDIKKHPHLARIMKLAGELLFYNQTFLLNVLRFVRTLKGKFKN